MRIGYCAPLPPLRTGVADFSRELLPALAPYGEPVLFSPAAVEDEALCGQFETHLLKELDSEKLRDSLDLLVYHVGNHVGFHGEIVEYLMRYPGVVELHEVALHHLAAAMTLERDREKAYLELATYCHGRRGAAAARNFLAGRTEPPWEKHGLDMCMNRPILEKARAVIVHSELAKQMVLGCRPEVPIVNIPLHAPEVVSDPEAWRRDCRRALGLDPRRVIMGSFGLATAAKRVLPMLDALARWKREEPDCLCLIVGEAARELPLREEIAARGLEANVLVTGFTTLEQFRRYMGACDFCLNLRYPTQGESSASLHRMLGMGKPVVVTGVGTFSEYPDEAVVKVRYDGHEAEDICGAIRTLSRSPEERRRRGQAALRFARENCSLEKNARQYGDFFRQVAAGTWRPDYEDVVIGRLCELGLTDGAYLRHVAEMLP